MSIEFSCKLEFVHVEFQRSRLRTRVTVMIVSRQWLCKSIIEHVEYILRTRHILKQSTTILVEWGCEVSDNEACEGDDVGNIK